MSVEVGASVEKETLESEAAETMTKLRTTLGKVRKFEKKHGRVPSEAELAEISSVDETLSDAERALDPSESLASGRASVAGEHAHTLREELNESRAYAVQLEHQVQDMTSKLQEFGEEAEAESEKINEAAINAKGDHAQQLREMSSTNQKRMDHLRNVHYEEMKDLREQHQHEIEELQRHQESDVSEKEDQIQRLQEQVADIEKQKEHATKESQERETDLASLRAELAELKKTNADLAEQHSNELDKFKAAADVVLVKNKDNEGEWQSQLQNLREQLEKAKHESQHTSELSAELAELKEQLEAERSKVPDTSAHDAEIARLSTALGEARKYESQVVDLKKELTESNSKSMADNAADREKLGQELAILKVELEAERSKARTASEVSADRARPRTLSEAPTSSSRDVSPIKSDAEKEELRKKLAAIEKRHQAAKENAKVKSAKQAEEYATRMAEQLKAHEDALSETRNELAQLQNDLAAKHTELDRLQMQHLEELNELTEKLQTSSEEIAGLRNVVEESQQHKAKLDEASSTIEELRRSLNELEHERKSQQESAIKTLAELKEQHSKQLAETTAQLDTVQSELERLKATSTQEMNEGLSKLQEEQSKAHDELYAARAGHEDALKDTQQQLEQAHAATRDAEAQHQERLNDAQKTAEAAKQLHENAKTDLEIQLGTLRTQLAEAEKAMEHLEATNENEINGTIVKLQEEHSRAVNDLKVKHRERLQQLEEEGRTMMNSLDELDKGQAEAATAHEQALSEQASKHSDAISELEKKSNDVTQELEALKTQHQAEVDQLKAEHASKLSEFESQPKGIPENEVEALKASHEEALAGLDRSNKELQSQVEGTRFQLQTMKGIYADQERQAEEKEKEHEKELQFERDQFSQAVMKISNHGAQLMQKDTEHAEALAALRKELMAENESTLAELKEQHRTAIQDLTTKFEDEQRIIRDTLTNGHDAAIQALQETAKAKGFDIEQLKADHSEALQKATSAAEAKHNDFIATLTTEHNSKLEDLRRELDVSHRGALEISEIEHSKATSELEQTIRILRQEHEELLNRVNASHKEAVRQLQLELADVEAAADQLTTQEPVRDTATEEQLRTELAETYSKIEFMVADHEKVLAQKATEHATALREVRQELDNVRHELAHRPDRSAEIDALKKDIEKAEAMSTTIDELQTQNDELQAQHSASQESSWRYKQRAEVAEAELRRTTRASPQEVAASPSLSSKMMSITNSAFSSPNSRSKGLQSSKWASVDTPPTKALDAQAPSFAPQSNENGLGLRDVDDLAENRHHGGRPSRTERNVHGQLAGINEDIRALNDLSERMFAENRLLAKTLSRVDEDTGRLESDKVTVEEER